MIETEKGYMNKLLKILLTLFILILSCLTSCKKDAGKNDQDQSGATKSLLADTGQTGDFTSAFGEDSDYTINPPSFTDNANGTVTDNIAGLMWQKSDGGEMTYENALVYCENLSLAGFTDWRIPTGSELFAINNYDRVNPALFIQYFTSTAAEYWWTGETRIDDVSRIWVVNAGGGIGAHPKTETVSAGGTKKFHARAVRNPNTSNQTGSDHFTDNGDGTVTDSHTGLVWQKIQPSSTLTWEEALAYAEGLVLAGKSDWRVPNIKELQSLNEVKLSKPSFNKNYFTSIVSGNFWSSTTLVQSTGKAWDINVDYGIVSYNDKTLKENIICVRGGI
jgi:hypothetical protein